MTHAQIYLTIDKNASGTQIIIGTLVLINLL